LTETFKLGLIKLIPKKGNAEKVDEWRPITLLSCGYKLISGVIATRLEKFLPKIIGRGQKGFLRDKNIGTVPMNIIDLICESWEKGEGMGVLCVDFVKAFDSVEFLFVKNVLTFFNFGPDMINKVSTLLYDRKARIILDNGCTDTFGIKRGTPQGDRSSPYIFLLCIEILLIKIESMDGKGVNKCNFVRNEVGGKNLPSNNQESYADDLTILFKYGNEAMRIILDI